MKLKNSIAAHKYIGREEVILLTHIRKAEAIMYQPGNQRDTRILASEDDAKYYRWYVSYGGDYRPQAASDDYETIGECIITPTNWTDMVR